jgi:methylase of polypeptide subunit release factors
MCVQMQDNRLYISPAGKEKPLSRVLDLGTGTGIWAIDLGTRVPKMLTVG